MDSSLLRFLVSAVVSLGYTFVWAWWGVRRRLDSSAPPVPPATAGRMIQFVLCNILVLAMATTGIFFAFLFFFADHQPYIPPLNNIHVLIATELLVLTGINVMMFRWLVRQTARLGISATLKKGMLAIDLLAVSAMQIILIQDLLFGG